MPTFKDYLHITNVDLMFKRIYVFKILRQTIVEQSEVEIFIILMAVENKKTGFEVLFITYNHYLYSKK